MPQCVSNLEPSLKNLCNFASEDTGGHSSSKEASSDIKRCKELIFFQKIQIYTLFQVIAYLDHTSKKSASPGGAAVWRSDQNPW